MLSLSGFELYSRWVPLDFTTVWTVFLELEQFTRNHFTQKKNVMLIDLVTLSRFSSPPRKRLVLKFPNHDFVPR